MMMKKKEKEEEEVVEYRKQGEPVRGKGRWDSSFGVWEGGRW